VSGSRRLIRAYRALPHERRLAAIAAGALFLTMFLPWYQRQFFTVVSGKPVPASDSLTAWGAFSFVEAAVLLVAAGVLTLLFQRAEGRAFHLPGGDGAVITAAGVWTCVLVVWRIFDKQGGQAHGQDVVTNGIEWGIFAALGVALFLTYAGSRIRAAHRPEPPLPEEAVSQAPAEAVAVRPRAPRDEADTQRLRPGADEAETLRLSGADQLPPARLQHEREVGAHQPDHEDARDDQRPGLDDVAEDADREPERQHAREQPEM
jgi:hypothetical protein